MDFESTDRLQTRLIHGGCGPEHRRHPDADPPEHLAPSHRVA